MAKKKKIIEEEVESKEEKKKEPIQYWIQNFFVENPNQGGKKKVLSIRTFAPIIIDSETNTNTTFKKRVETVMGLNENNEQITEPKLEVLNAAENEINLDKMIVNTILKKVR